MCVTHVCVTQPVCFVSDICMRGPQQHVLVCAFGALVSAVFRTEDSAATLPAPHCGAHLASFRHAGAVAQHCTPFTAQGSAAYSSRPERPPVNALMATMHEDSGQRCVHAGTHNLHLGLQFQSLYSLSCVCNCAVAERSSALLKIQFHVKGMQVRECSMRPSGHASSLSLTTMPLHVRPAGLRGGQEVNFQRWARGLWTAAPCHALPCKLQSPGRPV